MGDFHRSDVSPCIVLHLLQEKGGGALVGYQSYYIFSGSTAAIHLGLRVDPRIRGKRLGMNFSERGDEEMIRLNPKVRVKTRSVVWNRERCNNIMRGHSHTGFSSQIGTKLRDWAVGQSWGSCYSWAALSSNDSKTL